MLKHRDRQHDAVQRAKSFRLDKVAFSGVFWASSVLTGPTGPLSYPFLPKTPEKAIRAIEVYEFMT